MSTLTSENQLKEYALDLGQRRRAHALEDAVIDNPLRAAFELIYLRDLTKAQRLCGFGSDIYGRCGLEQGHDGNHQLSRSSR